MKKKHSGKCLKAYTRGKGTAACLALNRKSIVIGVHNSMQNKKIKARLVYFLIVLYIVLSLGLVLENRYTQSNKQVIVTPQAESGSIVFRGAMVDGSWYGPQDLAVHSDGWEWQEQENVLVVNGEAPLQLDLPIGMERTLIFNTGPSEGTVRILVNETVIERNLYNAELMDGGINLPYVRFSNRAKLFFGTLCMLSVLTVVMLVVNRHIRNRKNNVIVSPKSSKNALVELLRFFFCMCIVIHHASGYPLGAYLGVDFFFLLSGFFLMRYYSNDMRTEEAPALAAIWYTKKRYFRLLPHYLFSFLLGIGVYVCVWEDIAPDFLMTDYIWEILMMGAAGISLNTAIPAGWYCSALIISGFIVYFLLGKFKSSYLYVMAPVSLVLVFSWMYRNIGHLNRWTQVDTFIATGVLRGFAEMGLGCLCFEIYHVLKSKECRCKVLHTVLECACFCYIAYTIIMGPSSKDFICVLVMAVLIVSLFLEKSLWSQIFNNRLSYFLGSISIGIYLNHSVLLKIDWGVCGSWIGLSWHKSVAVYALVSIIFSAVSERFVENIVRIYKTAG